MTDDLGRFGLLASAIAGRPVEIGATAVAWTDGRVVYVDPNASPHRQVMTVSAQCSLLAVGYASRDIAVEAPRAMRANAAVVPAWALAHAESGAVDVARDFGTIKRLTPNRSSQQPSDGSWEDQFALGRGGVVGRLLARLFDSVRRDGQGDPGGDTPTHAGAGGAGVTVSARPEPLADVRADGSTGALTYPEWNVHRGTYRRGWCTVVERPAETKPVPSGTPFVSDTTQVRRALARLGVGLAPVRHRSQGDDIDIDAAIDALLNSRAGVASNDDYYLESLPRRRDLSVVVLLDVSGSANKPGAGGTRVHEHQVAAASALTTALHQLGDRVALYAFSSRGRHAVDVARVKSFDDPLDARVMRRLAGLTPGAYTRLGAAIRHGTARLHHHGGTPRKLLVVVSDGFAYDQGYDGAYGEADAARALAEARTRGIGCVCLSVGADADPDALRRVFGPAAHASMPSSDRLAGVIAPLFRDAIDSVVAR